MKIFNAFYNCTFSYNTRYNGHYDKLKDITHCFVWGRGALAVGGCGPKSGGVRGVEISLSPTYSPWPWRVSYRISITVRL